MTQSLLLLWVLYLGGDAVIFHLFVATEMIRIISKGNSWPSGGKLKESNQNNTAKSQAPTCQFGIRLFSVIISVGVNRTRRYQYQYQYGFFLYDGNASDSVSDPESGRSGGASGITLPPPCPVLLNPPI